MSTTHTALTHDAEFRVSIDFGAGYVFLLNAVNVCVGLACGRLVEIAGVYSRL